MRKMSFYNKEKNNSQLKTLSEALANSRKNSSVSTGSFNPVSQGSFGGGSYQNNNNDNTIQGAYKFGKGLVNLYNKGKEKGWFDFGSNSGSANGIVGSAANDYISNGTTSSSAIGNAINGLGSSGEGGSLISSAISSEAGSGLGSLGSSVGDAASSGGGFSWGNFGGNGGGGMPWGAIAGVAKQGYNYITDKNPSEYSEIEQSTIYPLQGAAVGGSYGGGWGALGGALYGLGYSLKDDIGLKDNNWVTDIFFPIGMGDEHKGLIQL